MFNELVLVHQKTAGGKASPFSATDISVDSGKDQNWFVLPTCLRQIAVGPSVQFNNQKVDQSNVEVFSGAQAYRFMLEVICGLKSPLIGETEIFGQFKTAAQQFEAVADIGSAPLRKFLRALHEDAKKVRELHLKNLGSQSYGSLVRRELKGIKQVHIIGAGQLTKDILPWLGKDGAEVHVHARNITRAQNALAEFPKVIIHSLEEKLSISDSSALIVAAPIEAYVLVDWSRERSNTFAVVIDLRGDSHLDQLTIAAKRIVLLKELFERITANQNILQERKDRALKEINLAVTVREQHVEYRPFGWEDVCA